MGAELHLAIVDPAGSAGVHPSAYPDFAGEPAEQEHHKPAELCAFAACTAGTYHGCGWSNMSGRAVPDEATAALVKLGRTGLSRPGLHLWRCLRVVRRLQRRGKKVAVTFGEAGTMQTAELLERPASLRYFFKICQQADGAVAATPEGVPLLRGSGARQVAYIPTPCPVDDPRWDFSVPAEQRRGILVGTFEFETNYRNHVAALLSLRDLAASTGEPVTVVIGGAPLHGQMVDEVRSRFPDGLLRVVEALPALSFVRLMATHKLVFQLDQAGAVGQVAAEALLCRIPCVGGYGAIERLVFPDLCGFGRTTGELLEAARRLLTDPAEAEAAVAKALTLAEQHISFGAVRSRLVDFFAQVGDPAPPTGRAHASAAASSPPG